LRGVEEDEAEATAAAAADVEAGEERVLVETGWRGSRSKTDMIR